MTLFEKETGFVHTYMIASEGNDSDLYIERVAKKHRLHNGKQTFDKGFINSIGLRDGEFWSTGSDRRLVKSYLTSNLSN